MKVKVRTLREMPEKTEALALKLLSLEVVMLLFCRVHSSLVNIQLHPVFVFLFSCSSCAQVAARNEPLLSLSAN